MGPSIISNYTSCSYLYLKALLKIENISLLLLNPCIHKTFNLLGCSLDDIFGDLNYYKLATKARYSKHLIKFIYLKWTRAKANLTNTKTLQLCIKRTNKKMLDNTWSNLPSSSIWVTFQAKTYWIWLVGLAITQD
jgi:hypothetical protein